MGFFPHVSPSRLVFSLQKPVTLCWFVFGGKSNSKDGKAPLMCLVYIEAELPDQLRRLLHFLNAI